MALSTKFILRRGLVNGSEDQLISCCTICCNLLGVFVAVKEESVLLTEKVLGLRLDMIWVIEK